MARITINKDPFNGGKWEPLANIEEAFNMGYKRAKYRLEYEAVIAIEEGNNLKNIYLTLH